VFSLLGPNGAGKTTTIRILCCPISKTAGEAQIAGYHVGSGADSLAIRKLIGLVPDNIGLYEELSAYETPDYYGKLYECPEEERKTNIEYFLKLLELWEKRDVPISDYSKGMKQKVGILPAFLFSMSPPSKSGNPDTLFYGGYFTRHFVHLGSVHFFWQLHSPF
jgi:ABC-2 type transport system ATP-binding protein